MTVDEFLAWAESREGRHELIEGEVFAMSPQRVAHAVVKLNAVNALRAAIAKSDAPCRALPDGLTVRISKTTAFEPDALVYCGPPISGDAIEVPAPIIVVEVISPGSQYIDTSLKLRGYFQVSSVMHYLVIDPERSLLIHHRRGEGDLLTTRIAADGEVRLDPPGLTLTLSDISRRGDAALRLPRDWLGLGLTPSLRVIHRSHRNCLFAHETGRKQGRCGPQYSFSQWGMRVFWFCSAKRYHYLPPMTLMFDPRLDILPTVDRFCRPRSRRSYAVRRRKRC